MLMVSRADGGIREAIVKVLKFYVDFRRMFRIVHQLIAFLLPHWRLDAMRREPGFQSQVLGKKALTVRTIPSIRFFSPAVIVHFLS